MEQRLVDINKIKEVTLEDSLSILTYTPDNDVWCHVEADTVFTIPENPTNGDMIKALFPSIEVEQVGVVVRVTGLDSAVKSCCFLLEWWNAPYKEG